MWGVITIVHNNNPLTFRLVASSGHIASIARHLRRHGIDACAAIHTLLGKSVKMIEKLGALAAKVESLETKNEILALVNACRGKENSKRDQVAASLGV